MKKEVPPSLLEVFREGKDFCLLSHAEPDGDCIGAEMALSHFLERSGKHVELYSPGPFERPEILAESHRFQTRISNETKRRRPTVVVLDCSSLERIGALAEDVGEVEPIVVVDHHSSGRSFGQVHYIDPSAPSVTIMVQMIIEAMGGAVDPIEAHWILFGFCTDTGFFRHLDHPDPEIFHAIARLTGAGASPKQIYAMMYGGRPLAARVLLGKLLARVRAQCDGRLLSTYETLTETQEYGRANRDSDSLYQYLQSVRECEVVVLIREESADVCSVGLRSNSFVDVGDVAQSFGGGGHKRAAGFEYHGSRDAIHQKLSDRFRELLAAGR